MGTTRFAVGPSPVVAQPVEIADISRRPVGIPVDLHDLLACIDWTLVVIVCQVCHPPVFGMVNVPVLLTPPKSTLNVPPWPPDATRIDSTYVPAAATLIV